ncbi:MAG: YiiX/YebB-like N1pC/P60 family cysteine hydrolase [Candidatus Aenigmatarchaeota archaeon]
MFFFKKKKKVGIEIDTKMLQPGDCVLISGEHFISRGIKWFTNSKYNHVALYVGGGEGYVIEATEAGVEKNKLSKLLQSASGVCIRRVPNLTVFQAELIKNKAYQLLYQNYDFLQFISMIPYFLFRKIGFNFPFLLLNSRNRMICSELYAVCLYAAGIKLKSSIKKFKSITPEDLYRSDLLVTVYEKVNEK